MPEDSAASWANGVNCETQLCWMIFECDNLYLNVFRKKAEGYCGRPVAKSAAAGRSASELSM